ncbi:ornithine cyclodeaminase/mu-crystallin [Microbacterium sp. HM58-2]|nr:ornithine cyclodeaminase/mu-crystallin [Microbacterium sp. HM58-2]
MSTLQFLDADAVSRALRPADAVQVLRDALAGGLAPERDLRRIAAPVASGEFLLMPSQSPSAAGVKVITVAPANPARQLPRIQGVYMLFDADTLAPRAVIDGPALTDLRTAAVSVAAVRDVLRDRPAPLRAVFYGAGPQAAAHLHIILDVVGDVASATAVVRNPAALPSGHAFDDVLRSGSPEARERTASAGIIVCATTARVPLFESELVADDAVVIAIGSHEADARELPSALLARADVIVEDVGTALRESGDVVMAVAEGAITADSLIPLGPLVRGEVAVRGDRPVVFKSSGMSWEDLVLAEALLARSPQPGS